MADDLGFIPDEAPVKEAAHPYHADLGFEPAPPPQPDMAPVQKYIERNLDSNEIPRSLPKSVKVPPPTTVNTIINETPKPPENATAKTAKEKPEEAKTFLDAIEAGLELSVTGLLTTGKPNTILPEDAPRFYRIASQVATLVGDAPFMVAGGVVGGEVGMVAGSAAGGAVAGPVGAVPGGVVGGILGAGGGANALPTAMREALMDYYEKGEFQSFGDFWERTSATFINTSKSFVVGAGTMGVGAGVGSKLAGVAAPSVVKSSAQVSSEIATMVTLGNALEGQAPNANDFVDAAALVAGLHGATRVAGKLREVYKKTGIRPEEVVDQARTDPTILQDILSENKDLPDAYAEAAKSQKPGGFKDLMKEQAKDAKPVERSEAVNKILENVGEKPVKEKTVLPTFNEAYKDYVDRLDPIKVAQDLLAGDKEIPVDKNPYILSRTSVDYKAKVKYIFEKGALDGETGATVGKSFKEILSPFKDDPESFDAYLISKRALEVEAAGKKSGFDVEAAKKVVSENKQMDAAAKEMVTAQNHVIDYLASSGRISKEQSAAMKEANKAYIPFSRIFDDAKEAGGGKGGKANSLKAFKGSENKIQSPLVSVLENTETLIRLAEKNKASKALVELAESTPGQTLLERVPDDYKPNKVSEGTVANFLEKQGLDPTLAKELTSFSRKSKTNLADNEFEVYRNGKREVWKTEDKNIALAIKALDGDQPATNLFFKLSAGLTTVKKFGITFTPDFIVKNLFRDQLSTGVFTKGNTIPFVDMFSAMGDIIGKKDSYYNWMKSGGFGGTFLELDSKYIQAEIFKLNKQTSFMDATWNVAKKPVDFLAAAGSLFEQASRLSEFKRVSKGASVGKDLLAGGFAAREITLDFQRVGAKVSALNSITAFMNVSIQGLDKTIRAVKEDPKGVTARAVAGITVPSVLLWWANKDDERYKNLPRWQKDLFWVIPTDKWEVVNSPADAQHLPAYMKRVNKKGETEVNNGTIYRLPKPQELGIAFGSVPERLLEQFFTDNPSAMKDFEKTMANLVTPSFVPDVVAPGVEQFANKSLFTGGPIVPHSLEGVLPAYQYTPFTSETSKQLAKFVRLIPGTSDGKLPIGSPMVIENYIRSWTGANGAYALSVVDKALEIAGVSKVKNPPESKWSEVPFVKSFTIRYPSTTAQPIPDFYTNYGKFEQVATTLNYLKKTNNVDGILEIISNPNTANKLVKLSTIREAMAGQNRYMQLINDMPDMPPAEKRQIIDGAMYGMIETAELGNQLMREISADEQAVSKINENSK